MNKIMTSVISLVIMTVLVAGVATPIITSTLEDSGSSGGVGTRYDNNLSVG